MTTSDARVALGRILIVEDNRDLALGLRVNFEECGYEVHTARTLREATLLLRRTSPDLTVLDLELPDGDGLELLRRWRAAGEQTLVLILTAANHRDRKLRGLKDGGDDYVTKPFDLAELMARVEALLRRRASVGPATAAPPPTLSFGDVTVDVQRREVVRAGRIVDVSRMGFELLVTLARRRGCVVPRAELLREVWGYSEGVSTRTLDTHIFELRRLIEPNPAIPQHIRTVWRVGYRLD